LVLSVTCLILTCVIPVPNAVAWQPSSSTGVDTSFYSMTDIRITLIGSPRQEFRLIAAFLVGATFYAYRSKIRFTSPWLLVAVVGFVACLFSSTLAVAGTIVFGAYLIFAIAEKSGSGVLSRINNENDVSYGLYLYAWPVTKLLHWYAPGLPLPVMIIATWLIAWALGWASWLIVEKPVMQWMRSAKANKSPPQRT
jgi:peptidoglycan/LPS O-acetylase OafA/YrhL